MSDMNTTSNSPFSTPIFEIYAGQDRKRFLAHAGMLSKSESLKALVEGSWKDGIQQTIDWEDWDEDTVARFLQWLYTRDYECPYPTPITTFGENQNDIVSPEPPQSILPAPEDTEALPADLPPEEAPPEDTGAWPADHLPATSPENLNWGFNTEPSAPEIPPVAEDPQSSIFRPLTPIISPKYRAPRLTERLTQGQEFTRWHGHQPWSSSELNYSSTLLAHAKIYILANCFMLFELTGMAVQRLRETLKLIGCPRPDSSVIADISALIEYVFAHTDRLISEEEPLRKLMTTYAASNYRNLDGPHFQALMSRGGDFVVEFATKLMHQLSWYETSTSMATSTSMPTSTSMSPKARKKLRNVREQPGWG